MPGISFICDLKEDLRNRESTILQSLDSLLHMEHYEREILLNRENYFLGFTRYKEYPLTSFENDDFLIFLEGRIYGKDYPSINFELNIIAKLIFQSRANINNKISEWLLDADGDFVILIVYKKTGEVCIFNDALSRLPLYYYKTDGKLIISRELQFITKLMDDVNFDRMAIAQYLLFGYPLGKRTLLENILRLEPATLIRIFPNESEIRIDNLHQFNFESKKYHNRKIWENAEELVSLFSEACKNRINSTYKNIVAMSGGLDSRSVAAGLHKNKIPFIGVSRLSDNKKEKIDVNIAEELSVIFGNDWKVFNIAKPKGEDLLKLLKMKSGLNYLGMSFILSFLDRIKKTYGSQIIYFTGDGGQIMKSLLPNKKLKTLADLIDYLIFENHIFEIKDVATLTRAKENEIMNELKNQILLYPENKLDNKYIHFIYERALKYAFEGEDRNRYYFWSLTPFYSIKYFKYAVNCPHEQKSKYNLYCKFLMHLCPETSSIEYANFGVPITSKRFILKYFIFSIHNKLPFNIQKILKKFLKKTQSYKINSNLMSCLREQLNNCEVINNYLSHSEIINIANRCNKTQLETLFTITSCIENFECAKSSIENYFALDVS